MEISQDLLGTCSPYIHTFIYDIDDRALIIECVKDPKKPDPFLRIVFVDINSYSEESLLDAADDDNLDDIVAITRGSEDRYVITTYKKEITIQSAQEPITERVVD
jgi:hypothetical protein